MNSSAITIVGGEDMKKGTIGTSMVTKRITKSMRDNAVDNYGLTEEESEAIRRQNLLNPKLSAKTRAKMERLLAYERNHN